MADRSRAGGTIIAALLMLAGCLPEPVGGVAEVLLGEVSGPAEPHGEVRATVLDGPGAWRYVEVEEADGCRLLQLERGSCDPACDPGAACRVDGACAAPPTGISAGDLTLSGGRLDLTLEALDHVPGSYWATGDVPADLFEPPDRVTARFSGDAFPGLEVEAPAVATLPPPWTGEVLELPSDGDLLLNWTPGAVDGARVALRLNGPSVAHGIPSEQVVDCDVADSAGSLRLARPLLDALDPWDSPGMCLDFDCPLSRWSRQWQGTVEEGDAAMTLTVRASVQFEYVNPTAP